MGVSRADQEFVASIHGYEALKRDLWAQIAALEAENARLQRLLAAAERLIMAHHDSAIHRAPPGTICRVCVGEHDAVQAIWRELHET